ncbi:MAG: hypothetical protein HY960_12020 [Ignavibacteriae bacterium]|nr:hypothetical protein [Ignavibacteriota bacterium]
MSSLTIEIPTDLRQVIENHTDVDWQEIARRSLFEYARKLALSDHLTNESLLTEEDVIELDRQIKAGIAKRYS